MQGNREKQRQYEEQTDTAAAAAKLNELKTQAAAGDTTLPRAHALIARMYTDVQARIEHYQASVLRGKGSKYKRWLRALPSDVAAMIAIRECIKICTSSTHNTHVHSQDLTLAVGKLYELEVRIRQAEAINPMYMQRIAEQLKENASTNQAHARRLYNVAIERVFKGEVECDLSRADMAYLGKFGVDACYEAGLLEIIRGTNRHGLTVEYHLNSDLRDFLKNYSEEDVRRVISKEESRMYCPPDPWTTLYDGGYVTERRKIVSPLMSIRTIRKSERARLAEEFTQHKMPLVFKAGNYLQATAFQVHEATRRAVLRVWESGGGALGVPTKNPPERQEMPLGPDWVKQDAPEHEMAVFNRWKRSVVGYYRDLRDWRAKAREVGAFLRVSRDTDAALWFPVYFDKRGRWYYRGVPNPQGSDMSKAVLHFHEKRPLGSDGVFWLKVHIANSYGFDKERFVDRARWTEQNWETISRALDEPENHLDVWGTDAPWCMFSAAWELREAYRSGDPTKYCTGIPVHMDATCSGLQHFSAMLRDSVGGQYVNLSDAAKCGPKQDIYARVAQNALQAIHADLESKDPEVATMAAWWLSVGMPRGLAKKPVN